MTLGQLSPAFYRTKFYELNYQVMSFSRAVGAGCKANGSEPVRTDDKCTKEEQKPLLKEWLRLDSLPDNFNQDGITCQRAYDGAGKSSVIADEVQSHAKVD